MKKHIISAILILACIVSCTKEEHDMAVMFQNKVIDNGHDISLSEATDIADNVFGRLTRSGIPAYNIEYILSQTNSVNSDGSEGPDTLAYILNVANNGGFMVVSTDDRVFPVLAYSEEGNFSYQESDDDIVYVNFVSRLDAYMAGIEETDSVAITAEEFFATSQTISPRLRSSWGQRHPYNTYVVQEHPGCPAGCVAVATGQIMTYCKNYLSDYHGENFSLSVMSDAIALDSDTARISYFPYTTKAHGLDRAAKLLYYIGMDVGMNYTPNGSGASSQNAYNLLNNLGYDVSSGGLIDYSSSAIAISVMNDHLVYLRGPRVDGNSNSGHAWVVEGAMFQWDNSPGTGGQITGTALLFCNWGWEGEDNGYFSGDVFETTYGDYGNMEYFSVGYTVLTPEIPNI